MPDISLLQDNVDIDFNERRSIAGIFSVISFVVFFVVLFFYIGLYFYVSSLNKDLKNVISSMEGLTVENASNTLGRLGEIEFQKDVLSDIRKKHTDVRSLLSVVSDSVYPNVYYESAHFDVRAGSVELKGVSYNSASLAGQVKAYNEDENIKSYDISDVSLSEDGVNFIAKLKINL